VLTIFLLRSSIPFRFHTNHVTITLPIAMPFRLSTTTPLPLLTRPQLQKTRAPIAIKAVSRQKLTTKLHENLESEINILKVISHRNVVSLEDCFVRRLHPAWRSRPKFPSFAMADVDRRRTILTSTSSWSSVPARTSRYTSRTEVSYLLSISCLVMERVMGTKSSGRIRPREGSMKRSRGAFLASWVSRWLSAETWLMKRSAQALRFLRSQDLIHRDIKPQANIDNSHR